jgi:hypothetical protein
VLEAEQASAPGPALRVIGFALVLLLTLELAVWGAFLVPLRWGEVLLPVSWVVAAAGNLALGWAGGRVAGRAGAVVPAALWLAVALRLASKRSEGDLVVAGGPGLAFLAIGVLSSAVAIALVGGRAAAARR